jgi:hypothetical protein
MRKSLIPLPEKHFSHVAALETLLWRMSPESRCKKFYVQNALHDCVFPEGFGKVNPIAFNDLLAPPSLLSPGVTRHGCGSPLRRCGQWSSLVEFTLVDGPC